jgi:hypothetical protein
MAVSYTFGDIKDILDKKTRFSCLLWAVTGKISIKIRHS